MSRRSEARIPRTLFVFDLTQSFPVSSDKLLPSEGLATSWLVTQVGLQGLEQMHQVCWDRAVQWSSIACYARVPSPQRLSSRGLERLAVGGIEASPLRGLCAAFRGLAGTLSVKPG